MALIAKNKSLIVLCANRDIIIFNLNNESSSRTNVPIKSTGSSGAKAPEADDSDNENNEPKGPTKLTPGQITHLAVSNCGKLLAATTYGDKLLHLYKLKADDGSLELLSQRELVRGSSAMRFTPNSKSILLADKTGDCYTFDCDGDVVAKGEWILGHFSMILDILLTTDSKYVIECHWNGKQRKNNFWKSNFCRFIVTSDRDEKIRITHYPRTEIIETYCLGHLEFVSSIETITSNTTEPLLLSVSGDKTLRLWNCVTGTELVRSQLQAPGIKMIVNGRNQVAVVVLEKPLKMLFLELIRPTNDGTWEIRHTGEFTFDDDIKYVNSMTYENDDHILAACHTENDEISLKKLSCTNGAFVESKPPTWLDDALPSTKVDLLEDVSIWFKKKFDNLKDYHERKKRRIEEKSSK